MKVSAIDLFCGIGGLTNGVQKVGIDVVAGFDIDKDSQYAYEKNNNSRFICKDVRKVTVDELIDLYPTTSDIKVLMGCAPCQPFSSYNQKNGKYNEDLDLLNYFANLVIGVQPDIVAMENVPQLYKNEIFRLFIKKLELNGYNVDWKKVYTPDYGVPQKRYRLILLASKHGKIELIDKQYGKEEYITVRNTIEKLPPLKSGEVNADDPMHKAVKLTPKNLERIVQSRPGGTWRDWDESLILECHKKSSGKNYDAVYGRMEWDSLAPTITTKFYGYGNGRFGHPDQNRALSYREGALLQTFPIDYKFFDKSESFNGKKLGIQIGNAVPVKLGEAIGKSINKHITSLNYTKIKSE